MFGFGKRKRARNYESLTQLVINQLKFTCVVFELDPEDAYLHHFIAGVTIGCLSNAGYDKNNVDDEVRRTQINSIGQILMALFEKKDDKIKSLNFHNNLYGCRIMNSSIGYVFSSLEDKYVQSKNKELNLKQEDILHEGMSFVEYLLSDVPNKSGVAKPLYLHLKIKNG